MQKYCTIIAAALIIIASFFIGRCSKGDVAEVTVTERDTTYIDRIIRDTVRLVDVRYRTRTDTCYLKIADTSDTARVEVPIETRTYETENYRAVIEGYRPRMLSIDITAPVQTITETTTITQVKRWNFSVVAGPCVSYGITPQGWQPSLGVGVCLGFGYSF